ncbi:MAG TPA: DNA polymerase/3'-5' exonuclease PolX [Polyangiaceae bacterium]|nr:DNA polymerase/3'-5' exonuclease PolX [Polyangiaceae bacterium]
MRHVTRDAHAKLVVPAPLATVTNAEVARALLEMSLFLEMADVEFKPRAYEKAAHAVEALEKPLRELYTVGGAKALDEIPGVGAGIVKRIVELLETGRCHELEQLRERTPVDVVALANVEGLGPKHIKELYDALHVRTLEELEHAARDGRIRTLPHFGEKSEQKLLKGLAFLRESEGRRPIGSVFALALGIEARLKRLKKVQRVQVAGSLRRRKETIGDLDFLVASSDPEAIAAAFATMPEVEHVYARGPTKTLVRLRAGIDADLRVVDERNWGAALCYFTGSKAHNLALRRMAQDRGLKLNEYGLFSGERSIAGHTEESLYEALGLPWIPPELREDTGEIEAAQDGSLPELIPYGALKGDLQVQTSWTDGVDSMEDMALAAKALGLSYIAITDHTRDLPMARGNDEERLLSEVDEIRRLEARVGGIRVLAGAEVNIRRDGSLDIADEVLAKLDVVGVGIHSAFQLSREEQTKRIIRAIENPHVDILFHPTARSLGRPPCDLDLEAVFTAARRTGTALEIDGHPGRLDLRDEHVRRAVALGIKLVISSDAHGVNELRYANEFGVAVARRGWARKDDVLNTRPVDALLSALK